ncbi:NAD(P)-binding domain-containing protein [Sneathiella limimaris]|uniref:NAD(P)-binding domain-containing protein n=1 Tax=Sneathiella limimaris TaxID=1964213 RepID=UPI00146F6193|nr:NAD(P)-binding domain-containing protein [Sneathiella limimaris]
MDILRGSVVGFIGLGPLGKNLAIKTRKAGAEVFAFQGLSSARYEVARNGISLCSSAKEIVSKVKGDTLVLALTNAEDRREILEGDGALLSLLVEGMTVIDVSPNAGTEAKQLASEAAKRGVLWVDAAMTGEDIASAIDSLEIAAGGTSEAFRSARPLLNVLGREVLHSGDSGTGKTRLLAPTS